MSNPKIEKLLEKLRNGQSVVNVEGGNSMAPKIKHREPVVLAPVVDPEQLQKGDIVFFRGRGSYKTHIIWAVKKEKDKTRFLITNIKGKRGILVAGENIHGKVVAIGREACDEFLDKDQQNRK